MEKKFNISDILEKYYSGELSPEERDFLHHQLRTDQKLREEFRFLHVVEAGAEKIGNERLKNKLRKNRRMQRLRRVGLAAAAFIVLLVPYFIFNNFSNNEKGKPQPTDDEKIQVVKDKTTPKTTIGHGGGHSNEFSDRPTSIAWNSNGEAILSGQFQGPAVFGNIELSARGEKDIFLAAYSIGSGYAWAKGFGSKEGVSTCHDLTIDENDNIIMTGMMIDNTYFGSRSFKAIGKSNGGKSDFYIAKFAPHGELIWLGHSGGDMIPNIQTGGNIGRAVAIDPTGNIIAAGDYIGSPQLGTYQLPVGGPNEDTYLAKYSPDGEVLWAKAITGKYMVSAFDVTTDDDGNIFVIGYFGHHNLGGKVFLDSLTLETFGGRDIFVAKYSNDGQLLWADHAGSAGTGPNGYDYGLDVAADNKGGCTVTGRFQGEARFGNINVHAVGKRDVFNAKYAEDGSVLWVASAGGEHDDQGTTVIVDNELNHYCAGFFQGKAKFERQELTSLGESDIFISKYNNEGKLLWLRQMGGDGNDWNSESASEMSINSLGQIVLTGYFSGKMKIGGQVLDSQGREDIFLVFFDKNGNLLESKQLAL